MEALLRHILEFGCRTGAQTGSPAASSGSTEPRPQSSAAAARVQSAGSAQNAASPWCKDAPLLEKCRCVRVLHQTSRIHNSYAIGHLRNDGKIMRDEQHRQPEFLPKVGQQFQNLRLNRYVESRRGFIRNQKLRRDSR